MKTYIITFCGREIGAIGIRYTITRSVMADNTEQAILKLYDTHEHISIILIEEEL